MTQGNEKNKTKKEKKYFGFMDFTENTNKWGKIFIAALVVLMVSLTLSRIYEGTYDGGECSEAECASTESEGIALAEQKTDKKLNNLEQSVVIGEVNYKLYRAQGGTEIEYVLVGWTEENGKQKYVSSVKGIEEKEMIATGKENEYVLIWGNPEETLKVKENGKEITAQEKSTTEVKIIELKTENPEKITFE